jgi:hypothetical protein
MTTEEALSFAYSPIEQKDLGQYPRSISEEDTTDNADIPIQN